MQISFKKQQRKIRVTKSLKDNLKRRKVFQKKFNIKKK